MVPGCARGCARPGRHLPTCADPSTCPGCQPRPAELGDLCHACARTLRTWLAPGLPPPEGSVPWVIGWLAVVQLGWPLHAAIDVLPGRGGEAPPPLSVAIHDTLQALRGELQVAGRLLCSLHGLRGPDDWVPVDLTRWLHAHIEDLAGAPFAAHLWDGFARVIGQAHALAPWRPVPMFHYGVPCPECLATALVSDPGDDAVHCLECWFVMDADRYRRWVRMLEAHYRPAGPWRYTTPDDWEREGPSPNLGA